MTVRFIIGRAGTGKTTKCLTEIRANLINDPSGDPIIYIVPDQMTFLSEYELVKSPGIGGMIRAQVYSFTRLAWRILQETGGGSRFHLSTVGINMLIRKIIEDNKNELKTFQLAADKHGFTNEMEKILTEFRRYCVRPEELGAKKEMLAENADQAEQSLQNKLADLELIYRNFEDALIGKYVDTEDYFQLLAEKIAQSSELKNTEVYIDGFHSFTPQEYVVIHQLMKHCRRVTIALTTDQLYSQHSPDELDLFRMTGETSQTLFEMANNEQIDIEETEFLYEQKRWSTPSLRYLERHFDTRPVKPFAEVPDIHLCQSANRRAELEGIARQMNQFVYSHGYRYRDIAVLMRNGSDYDDLIQTIFTDYEIPFFIDRKQTMLHHPLIELIRSTLEIINSNWRYEPVFRAVKTELLFPLTEDPQQIREQMDQLENYVLAYGIQGRKWTGKERWTYRRMRGLELATNVQTDQEKRFELQLNEWRLQITAPIVRLTKRLKKAQTGQKLCEAIFLYLEELDIKDKLEKWQLSAEKSGQLLKSSEHDQAWTRTIELLDQFVEILGDEKLSIKKFTEILDAGIETLTFATVPPAMDQVVIADLEKSRLADVKVTFVIGLNEGVLPAKISDDGILADGDRDLLHVAGLQLAPTSKTRLLDETFIAYKAFTTPSNHLFLSYPLANEEGHALMPSFYIKRMKDIFPHVREHVFLTDPVDLSEEDQLLFVANEQMALSYLTAQLERKKRNYPIYDFWWDVYNYYVKNDKWRPMTEKVFASLFYENKSKQLLEETTKSLYGEDILASVSRMEMFHRCPFSHYAQHGLKLRERQVFKLEAPHIGELFHGALKYIADTVTNQNLSWASLSKKDCKKLAEEAVKSLAPKLQNEILFSSNRHFYMKRKLQNVISKASFMLSKHAQQSGFSPVGLEIAFGPGESLPPLQFTLKNNTKMALRGRIDRIDKAEENSGVFLRIVDYKSSQQDLNLSEVYYGLSLQMLTYLDIVMTYSNELIGVEATPAGVLYFHVHNPIINAKTMLTVDEIDKEIFKQFKMRGLLLADEQVVKLMDTSLESGDSQIVSAGIRKDGSLSKRSKVAAEEQLEAMRHYVRNLYVKSGNAIMRGTTDISPYKLKKRTACTFCAFKAVCQFDQLIESNEYRILQPKKDEDVFELIQKEVTQDGANEHSTET